MKRLLLNILLLLTCIKLPATSATDTARISQLLSEVQKEYAPDRRVIFLKTQIESEDPLVITVESSEEKVIAAIRQALRSENIEVQLKETLLPAGDLRGKSWGVATFSVCNNRFAADHASEMATQLLLGTPVQILKRERGYFLVRSPDNYLSWTDATGIAAMTEPEFRNWQKAEKAIVTSEYSHVYTAPSARQDRVTDLVAGNILQISGKKKKFYHAVLPDGRTGYVPSGDVKRYSAWTSGTEPSADKIIATAKKLIGVPYLWGGTSVKGVDCSGFTKTCYFLSGVILPRDASQQVVYGEQVDIFENDTVNISKALKNLKAGDLLFFAAGKYKTATPRVTHTAIYLGDGKFIQAASLVRINSLIAGSEDFDNFQTRTLVNAKRILTAIGSPGITGITDHPFYAIKNR